MSPRLPALNRFADGLRRVKWSGKQTIGGSVDYVVAHRAELARYDSPEDLGVAAYDDDQPDAAARALAANLQAVRNALLEELWRREIFLGIDVVDQLLFYAAKRPGEADPLMATLAFLRDRRATRPGLVLFPLHSVGILRAGLFRGATKEQAQFVDIAAGVAITPQTNVLSQTVGFVERAREAFGVRKPANPELIAHWHRSRARWLERNPLLAIRMTTQRGSYYDTEAVVLGRVRAATARLAMISTFQSSDASRASSLFSTSRTNNWETLDIHHYIVFYDNPAQARTLDGDCVPVHARGGRIVELSDLSIELDPEFRGRKATMAKIDAAVAAVYQGHLTHMWRRQRNARTRAHDRLFAALSFFLRSFHSGGRNWSAAVSLSTALEMILTDSYSAGATQRLERRLGLVLHGVTGRAGYQAAFQQLYAARGDLVHAGTEPTGVDLHVARQAFVRAFCVIAPRVASLQSRTDSPMTILTGDVT